MTCDRLRDDQRQRLRGFMPGGTKGRRDRHTDKGLFLDALLLMARCGGRGRDLPERMGIIKA